MTSLYVRYYVFVTPLTLLSAWLLLSKPRTKPKAVAEPVLETLA